jgi:hypothetical protein
MNAALPDCLLCSLFEFDAYICTGGADPNISYAPWNILRDGPANRSSSIRPTTTGG